MNFQDRLLKSIPGGAHTYSRGFDQFSCNSPQILERGDGAYVFDPEGNRFLDYGMALRSVTLGYSDCDVNEAAVKQILSGNNLTRPSICELEAAELLIDLIPSAEMVKFAKNGSNVTTAALKLARAYTGKRFICVPSQQPFFSFDDWFIGKTPITRGIPEEHFSNTLLFDYGDISTLEKLFNAYEGQIAAVMLEPATTEVPCLPNCGTDLSYESKCRDCKHNSSNFLVKVQQLCKKNDSLFILDEMITGFRWDLQGAQHYFGVTPDLSTFGKAMANGFSLSALVGKRDIMELGSITEQGQERTFLLSTTHGAEMSSLGAFIATVSKYKSKNVCKYLWQYGSKLRAVFNELSTTAGLNENFILTGPSICMSYSFLDNQSNPSLELKTLFQQELVRSNVLMPWIATSLAHDDHELDLTANAVEGAFNVIRNALEFGVDRYLVGSPIKPVFRKFN